MIEAIAVDVISINYVEEMLNKHKDKFPNKILSNKELSIYLSKKRKIEFLAGRFAAKETIFKLGYLKVRFSDISILNDEKGAPYIEINNKRNEHILLSISHHKEYAVAFSIKEVNNVIK